MANYDVLDGLQQAVIEEEQKKQASKKKEYSFDKLALLFMEDYEVKGIKVSQPTIGDILRVGESNFYQALSPFLYNSTSIRVMLWEAGIDWCNVKDIEVFDILNNIQKQNKELTNAIISDDTFNEEDTTTCRKSKISKIKSWFLRLFKKNKNTEESKNLNANILEKEIYPLKILFKNIDITDFKLYKEKETEDSEEKLCLYSPQYDIKLYEEDYMQIAEYIREMLNVHPKVEKAKGKTAKRWMIDEDKMNALHRDEKNISTLLPLVSACVNHPGFKYKLQELREVGIYQFMDAVQRLQIYESSRALLQGSYSGFCDTSKVPQDNFNFMRNI